MALAFLITGAPALIIILAILVVLILGIVYFVKLSARGVKAVSHAAHHDDTAARR